jgi:glycosyltransferase involved in cell wall biosynthesis
LAEKVSIASVGGNAPALRVLVTAEAVGGVWQYSLDLARGLSRLGIETILAVMGPSADAEQTEAAEAIGGLELVDTGLPLERLASHASSLRAAGEEIAALAQRRGADLVHLNTPALAAGTRFGLPVVAVQHNCVATWWEAVHGTPLPADFAWRANLVRTGLQAADVVVAPTAAFGAAVQRLYRLDHRPRIVHNGRSPLALPRQAPHDFVFTAGRLWDEGKNLDMLDAAAERIPVPFRAAGPLQDADGTRVIFDNIDCLGNLGEEELARWLSARPVFVSAALYEPFGLAVLEAASVGCPLILSDIPTFRELWDEVAIFVPPRDEQGFTRAIANLVGDDFERAVMGRASSERAQLYTPDVTAAQMAAIYRGLLPAVHRPVLAAIAA